ncbi:MAG: hypothetical protein M1840_008290 [Geoglossum simile]|nr:MAG: hypothetical protein M1840_008290 [Geoglossum simile]
MTKTYKAKCHCGQTEWTADFDDTPAHVLCHCNACKLLGGGAYTLNMIIPQSSLNVTKGKDDLKVYTYHGDSGKPVHCYYCPNCTSHIYHHQTSVEGKFIARTIFFEGSKDFIPVLDVYGEDRLSWVPEIAKTSETAPA